MSRVSIMRCVASYRMLGNVIPCPDAVLPILSKSASSLVRWAHALSTVICVSVVSPSRALTMVCCAVCSLMYRGCHHRRWQVISPLTRLAGPPAPSYRWINEMGYMACMNAHHPFSTAHVSAAAERCTLLPCVLACIVMVYMPLVFCPRKTRLLCPVFVKCVLLLMRCL